ncbi:MAG: glycosyltransferase [Solirubrobacteraceae bacterium]
MIFVTVGTQLPFDRLISAVDGWAGSGASVPVFAQIGPSRLRPRNIEFAQFISPGECAQRMEEASAIIAHAGMGTILTALELGKPVLVMPRRAALSEHRNDHQLATAHRFSELGKINVAFDEADLIPALNALDRAVAQPRLGAYAPDDFLASLRAFIGGDPLALVPETAAPHGRSAERVIASA